MKSEIGFPLSNVILGTGLTIFLLSIIIFFKNLTVNETSDSVFYIPLMFGLMVLALSIIGAIIFPNSLNVELLDENIKVSSRRKSTIIPLSNIRMIEISTRHEFQGSNNTQHYKIIFKEKTVFGNVIYYKVYPEYSEEFTRKLKYAWLNQNAH